MAEERPRPPVKSLYIGTPEMTFGLVIFTVTWYDSTEDLRMQLCLETVAKCQTFSIPIVVVDGSPSDEVHSALQSSGAIVYRQTFEGKKGAALREAALKAHGLPGVVDSTKLCWMEAEKTDMVRNWSALHESENNGDYSDHDDIIMPWRNQILFRSMYPIEQYHSEMYGNYYLDNVAKEEMKKMKLEYPEIEGHGFRPRKYPHLDWHFGPFAFQAKHIKLWTEYKGGDSYDAQLVPIVHAMRKGHRVSSREINYRAPPEMQKQEEENSAFIEKRLAQLNDLDPKVKKAWTEEFYC